MDKKLIEINYPPNLISRWGRDKAVNKAINSIFDKNFGKQERFLKECFSLKDKFENIKVNQVDPTEPYWNNPWLPILDGVAVYSTIAIKKPQIYLEIGSGISTMFARRAISDLGLLTKIISVDPTPRREIDQISDVIHRNRFEDLLYLERLAASLTSSDVIFFDGSHRSLTNSDVTVFVLEFLPVLPSGITIGVHDIFWPNDYPVAWADRVYNEQYVFGAYMLGAGANLNVLISTVYAGLNMKKRISELFSENKKKEFSKANIGPGGASLWFEKP